MPRALLFVNAKASQTGGRADEIAAHLESGGLEVERGEARAEAEMAAKLAARQHEIDLLVVAGGDGTVRSAAEALLETADAARLPLGIIPLGTANNFARSLSLPLSVKEACEVVAKGKPQPADLARVNGRLFISVVGVGLSTLVHQQVPAEQKRRWGSLSYAFQAARLLLGKRPEFTVELRMPDDVVERVRALQLTVCNGKYYGAHLQVNAEATLDDGLLDVSIVEAGHYLRGFGKALLALGGRHVSPGLRLLRVPALEVRTTPVMKLDVEGAAIDLQTPAKFEILRRAISVMGPG
jgi:YegS/Rv2252/BmrU family lipid kinase